MKKLVFLLLILLTTSISFAAPKNSISCQLNLLTEASITQIGVDLFDSAYLEYSKKPALSEITIFVAELAEKVRSGEIKIKIDAHQNAGVSFSVGQSVTAGKIRFYINEIRLSENVAKKLFNRNPLKDGSILFKAPEEVFEPYFYESFIYRLAQIYSPYQHNQGRLALKDVNLIERLKLNKKWIPIYNPKINVLKSNEDIGYKAFEFLENALKDGVNPVEIAHLFNLEEFVKLTGEPKKVLAELLSPQSENEKTLETELLKQQLLSNDFETFYAELGKRAAQLYLTRYLMKFPKQLPGIRLTTDKIEILNRFTENRFQAMVGMLMGKYGKAQIQTPTTEEIKKFNPKKSN